MQVFYVASSRREPIVGVVGALQYDVVVSRLRAEYGVEANIEPAGYEAARWLGPFTGAPPTPGLQGVVAADRLGRRVLLFGSQWEVEYFERQHPDVPLLDESPVAAPARSRS